MQGFAQRLARSGLFKPSNSSKLQWRPRTYSAGAEQKVSQGAGAQASKYALSPEQIAIEYERSKRNIKRSQYLLFGGCLVSGAYAYILMRSSKPLDIDALQKKDPVKDYEAVANAIAEVLDNSEYDDGSYGPVLVRLAWHASGTYDKNTGTGGSCGATMRFAPECEHGANAGLAVARSLLEPIKQQFPWISYGDLWTLAGKIAIEEMGGPTIPWRSGRKDAPDGTYCTPDGRLPDASLGAAHIQDVFGRMGFNDRETVALIGAHTIGRCHPDRSGFVNPWTNAPTTFSNLFFQDLTTRKWQKKKWNGPLQYEDQTKELMMLPTDMALLWTKRYKNIVNEYAKDQDAFFNDFSGAFSKLLELGVEFPEDSVSL
nr:cytochrome C peroxidase (CCPR1) [Polytomella parva]